MDRNRSDNRSWFPVVKYPHCHIQGNANRQLQELHTLFVDNLSTDVGVDELRILFNKFGVVMDVFIPLKRSKVSGNKFGFVRYDCHVSADVAILKANSMWFKDRKLFVKFASFGKKNIIEDRRLIKSRIHGHEAGVGLSNSYHNRVDFCRTADKGLPIQRNNLGVGSYAEALMGHKEEQKDKESFDATFKVLSTSDDWLLRSAVAKLHKMMAVETLVKGVQSRIGSFVEARVREEDQFF